MSFEKKRTSVPVSINRQLIPRTWCRRAATKTTFHRSFVLALCATSSPSLDDQKDDWEGMSEAGVNSFMNISNDKKKSCTRSPSLVVWVCVPSCRSVECSSVFVNLLLLWRHSAWRQSEVDKVAHVGDTRQAFQLTERKHRYNLRPVYSSCS